MKTLIAAILILNFVGGYCLFSIYKLVSSFDEKIIVLPNSDNQTIRSYGEHVGDTYE